MNETDNSRKYRFADFTHSNYQKYLQLAKESYAFRFYDEFDKDERFVLWRHDIDFSVHAAYKIACLEAQQDIKATYFIHLHNPFYHFLEIEIFNLLKKIRELGHQIGLHFDSHFYGIVEEGDLEKNLLFEKELLENILDCKIKVFSFHNTTPFTLACQNWEYGGMINTYATYFQEQVGYCSDSNGIWRFRRLEDVLQNAHDPRLQILTHPEMWTEETLSPRQRIHRCIDGRSQKNKFNYDNDLKEFGRENIDW